MKYNELIQELGINEHEVKYYSYSCNKFIATEIIQKYGKVRKIYTTSNKNKMFYQKLNKIIIREVNGLIKGLKYYHSYIQGKSTKTNAKPHIGNKYLLKMDLENYFESFVFGKVVFQLSKFFDLDSAIFITRCCMIPNEEYAYSIFSKHNGFPVGISTSTTLSTLCSRHIDMYFLNLFKANNLKSIKYSRYSDDLTFSCESQYSFDRLINIIDEKKFEEKMKNIFKINKEKTKILGPRNSKKVTGIVINKKMNIPKEYYGKIRFNLILSLKNFEKTKLEYRKNNCNNISVDNFTNEDFEIRIRSSIQYIGSIIGRENKRYIKLIQLYNKNNNFKNKIYNKNPICDFIGKIEIYYEDRLISQGTCFLIDNYIITNHHVFENYFQNEMKNYDSKEHDKYDIWIKFDNIQYKFEHPRCFLKLKDLSIDKKDEILDYLTIKFEHFYETKDEFHNNSSGFEIETIVNIGDSVSLYGYPNGKFKCLRTIISNISDDCIELNEYLVEGSSGGPILKEGKVVALYVGYDRITERKGVCLPITKIL